jgi:CheY-like chemotaxis protein
MTCSVLLVTRNQADLSTYQQALQEVGFSVTAASSFEEARPRIDACAPDILVAALRLGEFNGLHLAIVTRMARASATTVILGDPWSSEADVRATGSSYLLRPSVAELTGLVLRMSNPSAPVRRSRRILVGGGVEVVAGAATGRLLDISDEGLRLEVSSPQEHSVARMMHLSNAGAPIEVTADRVWARQTKGGTECGLRVHGDDPSRETAWRRTVGRFREAAH